MSRSTLLGSTSDDEAVAPLSSLRSDWALRCCWDAAADECPSDDCTSLAAWTVRKSSTNFDEGCADGSIATRLERDAGRDRRLEPVDMKT